MATNVDASEWGNTDFAREEFMLKIQASILERCLRKGETIRCIAYRTLINFLSQRCRKNRQQRNDVDF